MLGPQNPYADEAKRLMAERLRQMEDAARELQWGGSSAPHYVAPNVPNLGTEREQAAAYKRYADDRKRDLLWGGSGTVGGGNEPSGGLRYANKGAIRNQPLTENLSGLISEAVSTVYGPGAYAQVYSGGQPEKGRRTGSVRHNHGKAADIHIYDANGRQIKGDELAPLGQYWASRGYGGVGMEMRGGGIHLDEWSKPPPGGGMAWNYASKGGRYTPAMRKAIEAGLSGQAPALYGGGQAPPRPVQTAAATGGPDMTEDELIGMIGAEQLAGGGNVSPADRKRRMAEILASIAPPPLPDMPAVQNVTPTEATGQSATAAPIVSNAEGQGGTRQINLFGGGPVNPGSIDRQRQIAEAMLRSSQGGEVIRHPLQGVAQMARAGVGALGSAIADRREGDYRRQLGQALMAAQNGGDLSQLYDVSPGDAFRLSQQRAAEQRATQQAALQRRQELEDAQRERAWGMEDYGAKKEIDQMYAEPGEQWELTTLPDGTQVQRNTQTGKIAGVGGDSQNININTGEVGKDSRKYMLDWAQSLQSAPRELESIMAARQALESGIISGAGADIRLGIAKVGSLMGITDPEMIANTETFAAAAADGVLQLADRLKGALTENERGFLERAAGGNINLNEQSIGRILDIRESVVRSGVDRFNQAFDQISPNDRDLQMLAPALRVSLPEQAAPQEQAQPQAAPDPQIEPVRPSQPAAAPPAPSGLFAPRREVDRPQAELPAVNFPPGTPPQVAQEAQAAIQAGADPAAVQQRINDYMQQSARQRSQGSPF